MSHTLSQLSCQTNTHTVTSAICNNSLRRTVLLGVAFPNPLNYPVNLQLYSLLKGTRSRSRFSHLFVCLSLKHTHTHKSKSYWLLTLTPLFLCFLVETGQGSGAATEGACMARRCDGKVGHLLLSLLLQDLLSFFHFFSRQTGLSSYRLPIPICFPVPSQFSYFLLFNSLMTMWSASQRQCGKNTQTQSYMYAHTPWLLTSEVDIFFMVGFQFYLRAFGPFCFTGHSKLNITFSRSCPFEQ